ncbi:hypothetical protein [Paenibacillus lactis]|uniref:hypothetical protein n=1 Tax=Paenibacillus lactis TaxID=228574 RepID=UPI0011A68817
MKKSLSLILVFAMLLTIFPTSIFAATNPEGVIIKEDEAVTDDGYTVKVIETTTYVNTDVFDPNGKLVDSTRVDLKTGDVTYTTADGNVELSNVDEYVEEVKYNIPEEEISMIIEGNAAEQGQFKLNKSNPSDFTIQALLNEPITDDGLDSSVYGDGYKFLGSSGVWYFDDLGYLFRKIDNMTKHEGHRFTFSAGTAISTVLSVVVSVFTGGAWTVAVITTLLITGSGALIDYFTGTFDYRTYNYLYKVRVYTQPWFETYRNISYWVSYNDATETLRYKQKSFNHGFSMANSEMVKAGIDNYMVANP